MSYKEFQGRHSKRHRVFYFMGRYHVLFRGKTMRTMRIYQWAESTVPYRAIFDNPDFYR